MVHDWRFFLFWKLLPNAINYCAHFTSFSIVAHNLCTAKIRIESVEKSSASMEASVRPASSKSYEKNKSTSL